MARVWRDSDLDSYLNSIINEENIEEHLVQESRWKISYRESQLERRGLLDGHRDATSLARQQLQWDELGISDQARETLNERGIDETEVQRFFAHPQILAESPSLFHYYRSLAGVSENRLRKMDTVCPAVRELTNSDKSVRVDDSMRRLCRYLNSLISTWASGLTDESPRRRALISALLTEGAAIEGSSRNAGGKKAVVNVASVIVEDLDERGVLDAFVVKQASKDDFERISASAFGESYALSDLAGAYDVDVIHADNGGTVNFSEPDMIVKSTEEVTAYAEIKDRKDVSNQWEGWLPLIRSKLVDFRSRDSSAERMVLQPIFTERMIEGERGSDAEDVGVRGFIEAGLLDVPFNISQIIADEASRDFFGGYIRSLLGYSVDGLATPK